MKTKARPTRPLLTAATCGALLFVATARASEWTYTNAPTPRIIHDSGWVLCATVPTAAGGLIVINVIEQPTAAPEEPAAPDAPDAPPAPPLLLDDAIAGDYRITAINERAFSYCYSLTSVTIPDSVTNIGAAALQAFSISSTSDSRPATRVRQRVASPRRKRAALL